MSTSDIDFGKTAKALSRFYLPASLFVLLFGAVYESFSHGVWSAYMVYAFLFPLLFGRFFWEAIAARGRKPQTPLLFLFAENAAVATMTVGFLVKGILEIYGTTNYLSPMYYVAGATLAVISVAAWFL